MLFRYYTGPVIAKFGEIVPASKDSTAVATPLPPPPPIETQWKYN